MAARVTIDFDNIYDFDDVTADLKLSSFNTKLDTGQEVLLNVKISNNAHELLQDVYNLSFGPLNKQKRIDDKVVLAHEDYSKVFSTILVSAYAYLEQNPGHSLGIDGSDNARAYFYFRALKRNFQYLNQYFNLYGVKYFVRITRFGKTQYDNPFDFQDIMPYPYKIGADHEISQDEMYNYFIFNLKKE